MSLRIGPVELTHPVVLAPMSGVTDLPFRRMVTRLGAGLVSDAFFVAFKIPNFFRRLFAEGAFNAAFVPIFSGLLTREGRDAARGFASETLAAGAVAEDERLYGGTWVKGDSRTRNTA